MRVSILAMAAVVAITFLSSGNHTFAMPLLQSVDSSADQSPDTGTVLEEVMKGVSQWNLDNEHTSMVCAVSHYGLSFVYGRFNQCSGTVKLNFEDPGLSQFRIEVKSNSLDTNDATRDFHLRGPDCLDAGQFESIVFESANVEVENKLDDVKTGRRFQVTGNLTLHGETRRIKIPIDLLAMGKGPKGKLRCGFMSRFVVSRSEFGLDQMSDTVGDSVAVTFCFQTVYQKIESKTEPKEDPREPLLGTENDDSRSEPAMDRKKLEDLFIPRSESGEVAPGASGTNDSSDDEIDL